MAALDPASFDKQKPQTFYLLDTEDDLGTLSDATLVVEGARLPVHSQILSLQSRVLRGLFSDLMGRQEAGVGSKRKAGEDEIVLEEPFRDVKLYHAALFLRFVYRPRDLRPECLGAVKANLPAVLRLAHRLDARQIVEAICEYMAAVTAEAEGPMLLSWVAAADHCNQAELHAACVAQLARLLAGRCRTGRLSAALADVALLEVCDKRALLDLLALALAAGRGLCEPKQKPFVDFLATGALLAKAQREATAGSFEWTLEAFSQQPAAVGQLVASPWFAAAGREWRFTVYPGGQSIEAAGHISVFLECKQPGVRAAFTLTILDHAGENPQNTAKTDSSHLFLNVTGIEMVWGWPKFMTLDVLRTRGYLAGDKLKLRAMVEVRL